MIKMELYLQMNESEFVRYLKLGMGETAFLQVEGIEETDEVILECGEYPGQVVCLKVLDATINEKGNTIFLTERIRNQYEKTRRI